MLSFSNGKIAEVPAEGIKDIDLVDLMVSQIEAISENGDDWALCVRIRNRADVKYRIADDWVVFIFRDHAYKERWLEINDKNNVWRRVAEPAGAAQPATQPADKAPVKDQPSTPTSKDVPHKAEQVVDGKPPEAPQQPR